MRRPFASAYLLLTLTALFWAGSVITGRAVEGEVPPLAINFWRWAFALAAVAPFAAPALWRQRRTVLRHWRILALLGLLNMTAFGSLMYVALQKTAAINGALLHGSMPINIVLVSLVVHGVLITPRQALGVALGFLGIVAIVARGDAAVIAGLSFNEGDLLMWLSIVFYALYSVYLPRAPTDLDLIPMMAVLFAVGVVTCLPLYLWETLVLGWPVPLTPTAAWSIGYLALFPSLAAQIFWVAAVKRVGANTAGYFIYLSPVFGIALAVALLGEAFRWFHAAGIALIFAGIYLATVGRPAAPPSPPGPAEARR